jgi:predicted transcriptional regulator
MSSTTIKVPTELRDRLAVLASAENASMATVIERALEDVSEAQFWLEVSRTMKPDERAREVGDFSDALADGLDSDEDWGPLW